MCEPGDLHFLLLQFAEPYDLGVLIALKSQGCEDQLQCCSVDTKNDTGVLRVVPKYQVCNIQVSAEIRNKAKQNNWGWGDALQAWGLKFNPQNSYYKKTGYIVAHF